MMTNPKLTSRMISLAASRDPRRRKRGWRLFHALNGKDANPNWLKLHYNDAIIEGLRSLAQSASMSAESMRKFAIAAEGLST